MKSRQINDLAYRISRCRRCSTTRNRDVVGMWVAVGWLAGVGMRQVQSGGRVGGGLGSGLVSGAKVGGCANDCYSLSIVLQMRLDFCKIRASQHLSTVLDG